MRAEIGDLGGGLYAPLQQRGCVRGAAPARGAEEAGAIFIKLSRLDGTVRAVRPGAAKRVRRGTAVGAVCSRPHARPGPGARRRCRGAAGAQKRYDPDIWILEVEDREGRHHLDDLVGVGTADLRSASW